VTGIEAPVDYLYHGPLGLQTRDLTWKPEYRQAVASAIDTLKLLKKTDVELDANSIIDDRFIREAFKQSGLDYDTALKNYAKQPLTANDAQTGKRITAFNDVAQVWVEGEDTVRSYAQPQEAFSVQEALTKQGKKVRAVFVQDHASGLKLLAGQAWYVRSGNGQVAAFLLRASADDYAKKVSGQVSDYASVRANAAEAVAAR